MTSRVGSLAYMDNRVSKQEAYDNTVDIYSLGLVYLATFAGGKAIYDECTSPYDVQRIKSGIYRNYEENIEEYIKKVPPVMKDIIKNALSEDY